MALGAPPGDDAAAKRSDSSRKSRADLSETRDPDREVSDRADLEIGPVTLLLLRARGSKVKVVVEDGSQRVFGHARRNQLAGSAGQHYVRAERPMLDHFIDAGA